MREESEGEIEECDEGEGNLDPAKARPGECTWECKIQRGCGDGKIEDGEECDGGEWCSDCVLITGCGNGVMEAAEECDGADVPADKPGAPCTDKCELIWCGDSKARGDEECDDGDSLNENACTNACEKAKCGDGFIQAGEDCDDGNNADGDSCPGNCLIPSVCGNGVVEGAEPCDDGNPNQFDGCLIGCILARCGDGLEQAGVEACDDGNLDDTDACLTNCTLPSCGDGFVEAGKEPCDDGNEDDTDACLTGCKSPSCGDGFVWASVEECDDGDKDDFDECNNDCAAPRFVFLTSDPLLDGDLGGVAGADAHCQSLADSENLPGTYMAWLTDGDKATEPAQRFNSIEFKGWYKLPTKQPTLVARGWMNLTTANAAMAYLQAAIFVNEKGGEVNSANVWTNTSVDGTQTSPDNHCGNWESDLDTAQGLAGSAKSGVLGAEWTAKGPFVCDLGLRLYCFGVAP